MKKKQFTAEEKKAYREEKKDQVKQMMESMVEEIVNAEKVTSFIENLIKYPNDMPSNNWSFLNRWGLFLQGSVDARGFKQWKDVGRYVKKGSKAKKIIVPSSKYEWVPKKDEDGKFVYDENNKLVKEKVKRTFFMFSNVFDVMDTDGEPLEYLEMMNSLDPKNLPLYGLAQSMNISIKYAPSFRGEYGFYSPGSDSITMCSDGLNTFLHELSHAIDHRLHDTDFSEDYNNSEVVAEFTACFLAKQLGLETNTGETKAYLEAYSENKDLMKSIENAFERSMAIIRYVLDFQEENAVAV